MGFGGRVELPPECALGLCARRRRPFDEGDLKGMLSASGNLKLRADMMGNLGWIVVNEMPYAVVRNAPEHSPAAKRANGGLLASGKDPCETKADDVSQLPADGGVLLCFHDSVCVSTN